MARRKEAKATIEEAEAKFHGEARGLEQASNDRWAAIDQRIVQQIELSREPVLQCTREVLGEFRAESRSALEEKECAFEAELATLEERFKVMPGKLPIAKTWRPETVTCQAEFISHEARCIKRARIPHELLAAPSGSVSRTPADGCDRLTPRVCGTYDAGKIYERLDIVATDGASLLHPRKSSQSGHEAEIATQ